LLALQNPFNGHTSTKDLETQPLPSDSVDPTPLKKRSPPSEDSALSVVRAEPSRFKAIAAVFIGFFIVLAVAMGVIVAVFTLVA
jgi:hypothetical protein